MPYIKYHGGRPPDTVRDLVGYEDPGAPCHEGMAKLSAEARRFAEGAHRDGTEKANATRRYFDEHFYIGLDHIGGVGSVDKVSRQIDEEIAVDEYQRLRGEIEKANAEYKSRRAEELAKNNDPRRRAQSAHEDFGWRTRVWVTSYTELEHHVAYPLGEQSVAYLRVRENHPSGLTAQLIDIYHSAAGNVEQALLEGTDWAEALADLLALSGYGAAQIANVVATTVPFCRIGEEFPLATFGASILNTPVPVHPSDFGVARLDPLGRLVLRHLRDGLSAPLPTVGFVAFWNALERQAEEEAKARNLRHTAKCAVCGTERRIGWNIKDGFESMYADAGLDTSFFDQHRSRRGTIQHGAKIPTVDYVGEILQDLSQVQAAAMVAVSRRVGVAPKTITYLSASWPVLVLSCRANEDGRVEIRPNRMSVRANAGMLPQSRCGDAGRTVQASVPLPPKVDPLALPPLQN